MLDVKKHLAFRKIIYILFPIDAIMAHNLISTKSNY